VKIGPVDTEIALLIIKKYKKEEINASKIYSPSGKFAELAKIVISQNHFRHFDEIVHANALQMLTASEKIKT